MTASAPVVAGLVAVVGFGGVAALVRGAVAATARHDLVPPPGPVEWREWLVSGRERVEAVASRGQAAPAALPVAVGVLAAVAVGAMVGSAAPVLAVGAALGTGGVVRRSVARRVERSFGRGLVPAVEGAVAALHGGLGLRDALITGCTAAGGVVGLDGRVLRRRMERGETFEEALGWWAIRRPDEDVALVVAVAGLAHRLGGPAVASLEAVAEVLRARRLLDDEVSAHSAQAVASAVLLAALPVVALALVALSDPAVPAWLLGSAGGVVCLVAGGVLEALGVAWMASVVRGVR